MVKTLHLVDKCVTAGCDVHQEEGRHIGPLRAEAVSIAPPPRISPLGNKRWPERRTGRILQAGAFLVCE